MTQENNKKTKWRARTRMGVLPSMLVSEKWFWDKCQNFDLKNRGYESRYDLKKWLVILQKNEKSKYDFFN